MSPRSYAENTSVSVERSKGELERLLAAHGATGFGYMIKDSTAVILFEARGRRIQFTLPLPSITDSAVRLTPTGLDRQPAAVQDALAQATRARWRALVLVVKAKLESVALGITAFEEEFLAQTVLPGGQTAGQWMLPQIASAYESGRLPPMLPSGEAPR